MINLHQGQPYFGHGREYLNKKIGQVFVLHNVNCFDYTVREKWLESRNHKIFSEYHRFLKKNIKKSSLPPHTIVNVNEKSLITCGISPDNY